VRLSEENDDDGRKKVGEATTAKRGK